MAEEKKQFFTAKQQEDFKKVCDHIGAHGPVSQSIIVGAVDMIVICSHSCATCGLVISDMKKFDLPKDPNAKDIYTDKTTKPLIIP